MTYTIDQVREAFPAIDGVRHILIKRLINKELDSRELELFESNQHWIKHCFNRPNDAELIMNALNELLDGHGTEAIRNESAYINRYYDDCIGIYVNMGDTYITTIVYDTELNEFKITSWGDFIEEWKAIQDEPIDD